MLTFPKELAVSSVLVSWTLHFSKPKEEPKIKMSNLNITTVFCKLSSCYDFETNQQSCSLCLNSNFGSH